MTTTPSSLQIPFYNSSCHQSIIQTGCQTKPALRTRVLPPFWRLQTRICRWKITRLYIEAV